MYRLSRFLCMVAIICLLPLCPASAQEINTSQKKAIILIMDNINYSDIREYGGENFDYLLKHGALGLMNTNSGGSFTDANAYVTIGAGTRAVNSTLGDNSGRYYDIFSGETVAEIFERNTGKKLDESNIANTGIVTLINSNKNLNQPVKVGLLGSLLNENGFKTAVIGNESRNIENISANAALIAMNGNGIVDFGQVNNELLIKDPMSPFGVRTNYSALYNSFSQIKDKAHFIVIQTGDSYRLNKYTQMTDDLYLKAKQDIFQRADDFLGKILAEADENTLILLLVPFPSQADVQAGKKLTPIIAYGSTVSGNVLSSPTTKRDGIITSTDIAAQITNFFSIPMDPTMTGHHFTYKKISDPLSYINKLNDVTTFNYVSRPVIFKSYIGLIVASLIMVIIFMLHLKKHLVYPQYLLTLIMITPSLFLLVPLIEPWTSFKLFGGVLLLGIASVAILSHFAKEKLCLFSISLLGSAALILFDTFTGNRLMKVSIFGYDPIGGARFYGIGNEYMGFLLGAAIIGTAALVDKFSRHEKTIKILTMFIYALVLFTLAHPNLGTNVGGAMAALVGFLASGILLYKGRISFMDLVKIGVCLLLLLLALFIYDGLRPEGAQSHIGQTSRLIRETNILSLFQIFKRKLLMNYKLIRYSNWTFALIAIWMALGMLFSWPVGILKQIFYDYKNLYLGFIAGIIGIGAAFIFNDSGVVAAAMSMIPIGMPLILLCIDEMKKD